MDWHTVLLFGLVIFWYELQKTKAAFDSDQGVELKKALVEFIQRRK